MGFQGELEGEKDFGIDCLCEIFAVHAPAWTSLYPERLKRVCFRIKLWNAYVDLGDRRNDRGPGGLEKDE